ncbi:MAG: hypothetical protein IPJ65_13345 [Archangiaceae bacterium]|nr:hypothetical protein [Archangiaceae bacterium]
MAIFWAFCSPSFIIRLNELGVPVTPAFAPPLAGFVIFMTRRDEQAACQPQGVNYMPVSGP